MQMSYKSMFYVFGNDVWLKCRIFECLMERYATDNDDLASQTDAHQMELLSVE